MTVEGIENAQLILWVNYGSDGWQPTLFQSEAQALEHIRSNGTYGSGFVVTRPLKLRLVDPTMEPSP